ncbi:ABC transporter permease [Paenibacillus apiarius]|uniref:ABC transporter permease n=1 Tax=Paenibacillus apiarius TaxID=46240 RepID=A0ABT4E137_9BACL|nr:ABC transporter permease [Paenibacillus apiarius]MBN3525158.1 ABC transporter permease [Paenibacillus apiarius]MCY9517508.1 ABC transporter permease [Paenibacillus apiarius]MCY9522213.1 ABC transporter permease [Paenibacillus apiarius]MCY9552247.1 ABC transporter permease [Paenibacillus apiarius]MCY9560126.1 ABC transporter permease [Paenibacillus apiarius]
MKASSAELDHLFHPIDRSSMADQVLTRPSVPLWRDMVRKLLKNKLSVLGLALLLLIILLAVIGPSLLPHSPSAQSLTRTNLPPSAEHWFGTDDLGRDVWARTWAGARISLTIGFAAAAIDLVAGILVGGVSGYMAGRGRLGDRVDGILMRIVEILYSIPYLLVIILLLVIMKPGIVTMIIALSITGWVGMARVVRGQILQLKQQEYVLAAQKLGTSHARIIFKHLLPNAAGIIIVNLTFTIPAAIFSESFLSFLGLGVQAPAASWGTMANDSLGVILSGQWWRLFFPGLMISLTMFAFNAFGDGLQDVLDPRSDN